MTSAVEPVSERADVRTIVGGGALLGTVTAIGVAVFAVLSRTLAGGGEVAVQTVVVLIAGLVAAYVPAYLIRPRTVDGIAWAALLGLVGALFFTVADAVLLRPLALYHWTWDAIGGGSGFWYIPVWWMGSATLAWLGAWVVAARTRHPTVRSTVPAAVATTCVLGVLFYVVLSFLGVAPWHAATMALGVAVALPVNVAVAAVRARR